MPSLEEFLNKKEPLIKDVFNQVEGTFQCQNKECSLIIYEASFDRMHNKIKWTCENGHDSSVAI
jgi:hypothetical protein